MPYEIFFGGKKCAMGVRQDSPRCNPPVKLAWAIVWL